MAQDVTLRQAAEELGVHYMTAYRYVRLGLLPARKQGTGWLVASRDLAAFRATSTGGPSAPARRARGTAPWPERLEARLLAGDARGAFGVIEAALAAGTDAPTLYVDVIAGAMRSIGDRWERAEIDVADEHRATAIALRLLGQVGARFARRGRSRGTVLVGTPPGERHDLPAALVADVLRTAGFDVGDLGSDLPAASFAAAARNADRLVAVLVSVTTPGRDDATAEVVAALREAVPDTPLLVGGGAVGGSGDARRALRWLEDVAGT